MIESFAIGAPSCCRCAGLRRPASANTIKRYHPAGPYCKGEISYVISDSPLGNDLLKYHFIMGSIAPKGAFLSVDCLSVYSESL